MNRVASQFRDIAREGAVRFAFCRFFFGPSFEFRAEAAGCRHGRPERRPLVAFRPALDSSRSSLRSGCLVEPAAAPAFSIAQQSTTWPSWAEFFVSFRWLPVDRTVSSLWRTIDVRTPCGCSSSEPSESSSSWVFFLHYSRVCRVSQRMVTVMPYLDSGSAIPQSGSHVDLRDDSHRQVFWYWLSSGRNLKKKHTLHVSSLNWILIFSNIAFSKWLSTSCVDHKGTMFYFQLSMKYLVLFWYFFLRWLSTYNLVSDSLAK